MSEFLEEYEKRVIPISGRPDYLELLKKLKTVKERVEWLLENFPETRNDDLYLTILYWRYFDKKMSKYIKYIPYEVIKQAIRPETIRRIRQKIQNEEGKYLPTDPKVLKKRRKMAKLMRRAVKKF